MVAFIKNQCRNIIFTAVKFNEFFFFFTFLDRINWYIGLKNKLLTNKRLEETIQIIITFCIIVSTNYIRFLKEQFTILPKSSKKDNFKVIF